MFLFGCINPISLLCLLLSIPPLMDRFQLSFIAVVVIAAVAAGGHADITPQEYWKKVLPNTPIPNSILEKLHPDVIDEKTGGTTVGVGRKGVGVNTGHGNTHVDTGNVGVNVNTGHHHRQPVIVHVNPGNSPFNYVYAATADQLHDDPNVALFFLEKDLHPGSKFNVLFPKSNSGPNFLPRKEADAIPFSSAKISETLKYFSINPNSNDAQAMMETQKECERPAIKGETKYCATSLESMIDFATSKLGKKVKAIATESQKEAPKQQYTIASGVQKMVSSKSVSCHIQPYVHAVYFCHESSDTSAYVVPLVGDDKTKVDAVAVCHKDTSQWNPKHVAFLKLKVKPGSVPICHFIPEDHIVWVQN